MNNRRVLYLTALISTFLTIVPIASASPPGNWPNSLNSGYGITTDYHGMDVPLGTPVTAYAATTEDVPVDVKYVVIMWLRPDDSQAWVTAPIELVDSGDMWTNGKPIYYATDTRTPDVGGDWGVKAIFYDKEANEIDPAPPHNDKVAIKATSFFHIPEIPLGTIMATLSMILALLFTAGKSRLGTH